MNQADKRIIEYIKRAQKIVGIEMEGEYKTPENLLAMTAIIVETAKMLQQEELEFIRRIRQL